MGAGNVSWLIGDNTAVFLFRLYKGRVPGHFDGRRGISIKWCPVGESRSHSAGRLKRYFEVLILGPPSCFPLVIPAFSQLSQRVT